jgi:hypothetical protein
MLHFFSIVRLNIFKEIVPGGFLTSELKIIQAEHGGPLE